jgi:hypothetical protein
LSEVAKRVPEAATEAGFFGFGRTLVNDAEKAALVEIGKALSQHLILAALIYLRRLSE